LYGRGAIILAYADTGSKYQLLSLKEMSQEFEFIVAEDQ
jgi:hypothetical protein